MFGSGLHNGAKKFECVIKVKDKIFFSFVNNNKNRFEAKYLNIFKAHFLTFVIPTIKAFNVHKKFFATVLKKSNWNFNMLEDITFEFMQKLPQIMLQLMPIKLHAYSCQKSKWTVICFGCHLHKSTCVNKCNNHWVVVVFDWQIKPVDRNF